MYTFLPLLTHIINFSTMYTNYSTYRFITPPRSTQRKNPFWNRS